ncbi:hypothetical protein [Methylocapsa palsarum]|uniref:Uncharacterized protein n=1 Tax=Methylocapsa palsarum TaxID=1612308 RepID=A0A1I3YUF5_9HYPH|nr:hypothetical protein [Methylocapsa palsarum]SFK35537.1 hypothetical protein SAMN05444581_106196 [Methylocapsa palsarum]
MSSAKIDKIHAGEGIFLKVGSKFLDLTIDLSDVSFEDCPPISHYRLAVREGLWLRRLLVAAGDEPEVGTALALATSEPDESLEGAPARPARITTIGIVWNAQPDFSGQGP